MPIKKTAIFPGTFDPITLGHVDLIQRSLALFDTVLVAITAGTGKTPAFSLEERLSLIKAIFPNNPNVKAEPFSGLLVDLMQTHHIQVVIRGLRTLADAEYEFQLATMNRSMQPQVETIFLQTDPKYAHISSTVVREIAAKSTIESLDNLSLFVPPPVVQAFKKLKINLIK